MKKIIAVSTFILCAQLGFAGPIDSQIEKILANYFKIQTTLTKDSTQGIDAAARAVALSVNQTKSSNPEIGTILNDLEKAASGIQGKDLKSARDEFFALSKPLLIYLNKFYAGEKEYLRVFCSMAKRGWVQSSKEIRNPYYGSEMLTCGSLIE